MTNQGPGGKDEDSGDIVFYYSREHRLRRASSAVRELNEGGAARPGMIKTLAGSKSNLFLLVSILMICVMLILSSRIPGGGKGFKLGGNTVVISIVRDAAGKTAVTIAKTMPEEGDAYTGAVGIVVSPVISKKDAGKTPEIYSDKIFFTLMDAEDYRLPLPFGGENFLVMAQTENERKSLRIKAKTSP
jgi:hypothetical protein